ncbi:uncharacterized protein LOC117780223 [Drosophila innubila]|uniref:uncharacterized protein LOC117780223 n=1 Tax=Drosophila innubila TaxID=198719 RepID=UPI00148E49E7|nr:uncharacterized protein LOC117780223 [Drosophila innubila]
MLSDRCGAGSILVSSWVTSLRGSKLTTANTHPQQTQKLNYRHGYHQAMDTVGTSRTAPTATRASSDAKRNIWSAKIIFVLLGLHNTLRNYGPPSVPHKTSEIATILKTVSSFNWAPYCYELLVTLWAAPAGSSVLRVGVPSLARSPNNRLHHRYTNSCGERNYTTLQQKTTEIHNINNKTCNQQQNGSRFRTQAYPPCLR